MIAYARILLLLALLLVPARVAGQEPNHLFIPSIVSNVAPTSRSIEDLLRADIPRGHELYYFEIHEENEDWVYGSVATRIAGNPTSIPDQRRFLLNKILQQVSYEYGDGFAESLNTLPLDFIPVKELDFLKSAHDVSVQSSDSTLELSFPWMLSSDPTDYWRYTNGPHLADPNHDTGIWSGLDFGPPKSGRWEVVAAEEGYFDSYALEKIFDSEGKEAGYRKCGMTIDHIDQQGNYQTRYIHIDPRSTSLRPGDTIHRNAVIGTVQAEGKVCYGPYPPHLHMDLRQEDRFVNMDMPIGGWRIGLYGPYQYGLAPLVQLTQEGDYSFIPARQGKEIVNTGLKGDEGFYKEDKIPGAGNLCTSTSCIVVSDGAEAAPKEGHPYSLRKALIWSQYRIAWYWDSPLQASSDTAAGASLFACQNFDIGDLPNFFFPNSTTPLTQATRLAFSRGSCELKDYPVRKLDAPINPSLPPGSSSNPVNYGCSNQTSGIKF